MFDSSFFVAVSFLIFVGLVVYLGLPKIIINALDQRSKDIKKELDEARNLREEAQKMMMRAYIGEVLGGMKNSKAKEALLEKIIENIPEGE